MYYYKFVYISWIYENKVQNNSISIYENKLCDLFGKIIITNDDISIVC